MLIFFKSKRFFLNTFDFCHFYTDFNVIYIFIKVMVLKSCTWGALKNTDT